MYKTLLTIAAAAVLAVPVLLIAGDKPAKAPDFTLKNYDGTKVNLADYKGKIVVLEWFSYECPFSRYNHEKTSVISDLVSKYKDKGVIWLAINSTGHQQTAKNKEYAEKNNISYPVLDDSSGKTGKAYGAKTTPHIFIINAEGAIVYNGALDNAPLGKVKDGETLTNYVDKALEELTAGKPVTTPETKSYGCSVKYGK